MEERLQALDEELRQLRDEFRDLSELEETTEEQDLRFIEVEDELDQLLGEREELTARIEKLTAVQRALDAGKEHLSAAVVYTSETVGTDDPLGEPEKLAPNKRLFDLDEVARLRDLDGNGNNELVARALDAVDSIPDIPGTTKPVYSDDERRNVKRFLRDQLNDDDDANESYQRKMAAHVIAMASPEYMKAFRKVIVSFGRTGTADVDAVRVVQRAMSLTDGEGGYTIPLPIDPTLIKNYDPAVNPFRAISRVLTTTSDVYRSVNTTLASFSFDAEAAEVSDDATTLANIDITPAKGQGFIPFSIEIGQDFPNFTAVMGDLIRDGVDDEEATQFATGSGTNAPVGIVTALTGGSYEISSNGSDAFAMSDVYDLDEELPSGFGNRASWVANKRVYQAIRESGGANLDDFWVGARDGLPGQLLGHPVYEASAMDGTWGSGENYVLILGDFQNYWIVDRAGASIELVPHLFATGNNRPSGQRGLYVWWRVGADSVNDRAFRMLNVT